MGVISHILKILDKLRYVFLYYVLGTKGMLLDNLNKKYNRFEPTDRTGCVAVVTGGGRGIGKNIVKLLLECNIHVIIGCRTVETGKKAVEEIRKAGCAKGNATVLHLDLKSLKSVQQFADKILQNHKQINFLINNAGIMFAPYEETVDGFESQFAVNYLGHFLLTHLLIPALTNSSKISNYNPRIINVSSIAHEVSPQINFNDLDMKKYFITHSAYAQSKMCQIMFTKTLNKNLREIGSSIQVIAVHPGIVNTDIFEGTLVKILAPWYLNIFCKGPMDGAVTVTYACISEELETKGGSYYSNCKPAPYIKYIDNTIVQEKLYEASITAVKPYLSSIGY